QAYQKELMKYQKDMQEKSAAIEKSYREALQQVQESTLDATIKDVAGKKKVSVVLNSSQSILLNDKLDITDDVITVLNRRLPKMHMDTPKGF
ncbi:MAG: OmpH family outer membrane protein, partial [Alphaproteobacteria bacterium]|nr:OmpH family outer membrane protein [Alphaproteobacteria bacterium]